MHGLATEVQRSRIVLDLPVLGAPEQESVDVFVPFEAKVLPFSQVVEAFDVAEAPESMKVQISFDQ